MERLEERLYRIIRSTADWILVDGMITRDHSLKNDLGFDSLSIVHLQVAIEDDFGIRFDPINTDFIAVFETVGSLSDFINTLLPIRGQQNVN